MKVYDCFMYFDEDTIVDLRLNCLNNYVDKFVIVESKFTHSGKKRDLLFDINKFDQFKDSIPLKRYGNVSEISEVISFLASDGASYITGQGLNIDGGWSAW